MVSAERCSSGGTCGSPNVLELDPLQAAAAAAIQQRSGDGLCALVADVLIPTEVDLLQLLGGSQHLSPPV
eukprot:2962770-Amphidinium_carterae.1